LDKQPQGPTFDRFLMRVKDFIIISTAVFAMCNWIYKRSEDQNQHNRATDERLANLERTLLQRAK